jgi:hemolysin activation/secretion protein
MIKITPPRLMRTARPLIIPALVICIWHPAAVHGQNLPDAGQILRELRQPALPGELPAPAANPVQNAPEPSVDEVKITITSFEISGNSSISNEDLQELLTDRLGQRLGLSDLRNAAARLTALYRERGYPVARAYLPAQDIKGGKVAIVILEGHIGKVLLRNASSLSDERALAFFKKAAAGAVIRSDQVDRALLLLNDVPGVGAVRATLQPGAVVGTSDMVLELDPGQKFAGNVALDNHGNRYTGNVRMSGSIVMNNLSGIGDQLSANGLLSNHKLGYGRLAYSLPIGSDGMRAALAYSSTQYQLAHEFAALDAHGRANSLIVSLAYPFIRRQRGVLSGSVGLESRRLSDRIGAIDTLSEKRAQVFNVGLAGNFQDALGGGASSSVELFGSFGKLDIESPAALAIDDATVRTNGSYSKLYFGGNRLQRLTDQDQLWLALSGQWAQKNLDSSEKFLIAGPGGVRAYPEGEAIGDDGYLATVELRHNFSGALQGTVFYDAGSVKLNHTAYDSTSTNRRTLGGAGLGFNAVLAGTDLRASLAWRTVGGDPLSVPAGASKSPTLWVRANRPF